MPDGRPLHGVRHRLPQGRPREGADRGLGPHGRPPRDNRRPRSREAAPARRSRQHVRPVPRPGGREQCPRADPAVAARGTEGGPARARPAITLDDVQTRWRRITGPATRSSSSREPWTRARRAGRDGAVRQAGSRRGGPRAGRARPAEDRRRHRANRQVPPTAGRARGVPRLRRPSAGECPLCTLPRDGGQVLRGLGPVRRSTRPGHGLLPLARGSGRPGRERTGEAR